jgi:hypothetical protein
LSWPFDKIWLVDFEFHTNQQAGGRPSPVCVCAFELRTRELKRQWLDGEHVDRPPYGTGTDDLFVAFYASAEMGCHLAQNWPLPPFILDLFIEFRVQTNGLRRLEGNGLLAALAHFGLDTIGAVEKEEMRQLVLRGPPYSAEERVAILDYCEGDVFALRRLLLRMAAQIDLPRALLRGRYMPAAARMEWAGIPTDVELLGLLRTHWEGFQYDLIRKIDVDYGVFDGSTCRYDKFAAYLARTRTPWLYLESGRLDLSDTAFRQMANIYPHISPLRELRSSLAKMRLFDDLAVGLDGRNRTILSAFRSKTGRNQPSNARFIFGYSRWLRGLIKPPPGYAIAYIDWAQQEIGILAALSGDAALQEAYHSGNCYLAFAKQVAAVPQDATRETHEAKHEQFKQCMLGVGYGMGERSLGYRIGQSPVIARELLQYHRQTFRRSWEYSDAGIDFAILHGYIYTVFGFPYRVDDRTNPRSLRNYPMQANGSEMLRLACCLATERGVEVCAPVHDAVLIYAPIDRIDASVTITRAAMAEASRIVLAGFELRTDFKIVKYPDRYMDKRGAVMWNRVMELIAQREGVARLTA